MATTQHKDAQEQNRTMERYYRLQSKIYDSTRWTFLFGRNRILRLLPFSEEDRFHLLEVGCGTGYNLRRLARRFPHAQLTGYDVSSDMARRSRKVASAYGSRIAVEQRPYLPEPSALTGTLDAILFSYSLTMINPQWEDLLRQAHADLKPGGVVAVADFHDSRFPAFKSHMGNNHVRMDGHLLPVLRHLFAPAVQEVHPAYGGAWEYLVFLGKKDQKS